MFHCINLFVHSHISLDRGQLSKKKCLRNISEIDEDWYRTKKSTESIIVSKNISIVCNKNHRLQAAQEYQCTRISSFVFV